MNFSKAAIIITLLASLLSFVANGQSAKSDSYFAKGVQAYNMGKYLEAIKNFEKSHRLDFKELPETNVRREYSRDWLAHCYYLTGDTVRARKTSPLHYSFEPIDRRLTIESDYHGQLSHDCAAKDDLEGAIRHSIKCLQIEERILGQNSYFTAGTAQNIANNYALSEDFDKSLEYCAKALDKLDNSIGRLNIYAFDALQLRVDINMSNGFSASVSDDIREMKNIAEHIEKNTGDSFPAGVAAFFAANMHTRNKNHIEAVIESKIAIKKTLAAYKADDEGIFNFIMQSISLLTNLGQQNTIISSLTEFLNNNPCSEIHSAILYDKLGHYYTLDTKRARQYLEKSVAILKNQPDYIHYYHEAICDLATLLFITGEATKAFAMLDAVCDYYKSSDPDNPTFAFAIFTLTDIYESQGRYSKALECYDTLNECRNLSHDDPDYILTQLKRVSAYLNSNIGQDNFNESYYLGKEIAKHLSSFDFNKAMNRGIGYHQILNVLIPFIKFIIGTECQNYNWAQLEAFVSDILYKYLIPICSTNHPMTCEVQTVLAAIKYMKGENSEAINLQQQAIEGYENIGFNTDGYHHDMALYQFEAGNKTEALSSFIKSFEFLKNSTIDQFRWMTLAERTEYTNSFRGNIDILPHYSALMPKNSDYARLGYNALLFGKGLLLNSTIELTRLLQEAGDNQTLTMLEDWREANLRLQNIGNSEPDLSNRLKTYADSLERKLIARSHIFGDYTATLAVDYTDVRKSLGTDDIAVELFSWIADARSREYGALVLTKDCDPIYVSIGKDRDWWELVNGGYGKPELFDVLFANLKPYMPPREKGTVYFAPDGIIHTIAIENLEGAEKYDLRRLSSTRELALKDKTTDSNEERIAIYGGIQYRLGNLADISLDNSAILANYIKDLPGTLAEACSIDTLLKEKMNVDLKLRDTATEEAFKNLSGKNTSIVHLATHGFFKEHTDRAYTHEDAMESSGLYFAGAQNTIWDEPCESMMEDGILSAREISVLDFRGMKLAVLSACETARGTISPEGIFGLQRGFKQAGTQSLLLSLWKVDDAATKVLMENFYRHLAIDADPNDALRKAREATRQIYPDPKLWAAFVLIDAK